MIEEIGETGEEIVGVVVFGDLTSNSNEGIEYLSFHAFICLNPF